MLILRGVNKNRPKRAEFLVKHKRSNRKSRKKIKFVCQDQSKLSCVKQKIDYRVSRKIEFSFFIDALSEQRASFPMIPKTWLSRYITRALAHYFIDPANEALNEALEAEIEALKKAAYTEGYREGHQAGRTEMAREYMRTAYRRHAHSEPN